MSSLEKGKLDTSHSLPTHASMLTQLQLPDIPRLCCGNLLPSPNSHAAFDEYSKTL